MASQIFRQCIQNMAKGLLDFTPTTGDSFKCLLVVDAVSEAELDAWNDRADITDEISGTGYTAGGKTVTVSSLTLLDAPDGLQITIGSPAAWTSSTISSAGAIIYKDTGVAANDILVAFVDFGGTVSSSNGDFTLTLTDTLDITVA